MNFIMLDSLRAEKPCCAITESFHATLHHKIINFEGCPFPQIKRDAEGGKKIFHNMTNNQIQFYVCTRFSLMFVDKRLLNLKFKLNYSPENQYFTRSKRSFLKTITTYGKRN